MHSTLVHLRVTPTGADGSLNEHLPDSHPEFPLHQFNDYHVPVQKRLINWPQSFARRGLNFADYRELIEASTFWRFEFEARTGSPLGIPRRAAFERRGDIEATLQGDLLTCRETHTGLYLRQLEMLGGAVRKSFLLRHIETPTSYRHLWLTGADGEAIAELTEAITIDAYAKFQDIKLGWNPKSDLLYLGFDPQLLERAA